MTQDRITVETVVDGPVDRAWDVYVTPEHVRTWNFASDDWHCPEARAELREGGRFSSRMEAKDGSMGFDFEGTYTRIVLQERIESDFGERHAVVTFAPEGDGTAVRVSFDPESDHPIEAQRDGWQAILDNYARRVAAG